MEILINGKNLKTEDDITVMQLLETLNCKSKQVVIELNENILPQENYNQIVLTNNDKIEVIEFVAGG